MNSGHLKTNVNKHSTNHGLSVKMVVEGLLTRVSWAFSGLIFIKIHAEFCLQVHPSREGSITLMNTGEPRVGRQQYLERKCFLPTLTHC